jgi:hypothetical protein
MTAAMTIVMMVFTMPFMFGEMVPVPMMVVLFIVSSYMVLLAMIVVVVVNRLPVYPPGDRGIVYNRRWGRGRVNINRRRRRCYIDRCSVNRLRDGVQ